MMRSWTLANVLPMPALTQQTDHKGVSVMKMEYQQVKERVEKEDKALKRIVIEAGIEMLVFILAASFLFR